MVVVVVGVIVMDLNFRVRIFAVRRQYRLRLYERNNSATGTPETRKGIRMAVNMN